MATERQYCPQWLTYLRYLCGSGIEPAELDETKITTTIHGSHWPIEERKESDTLKIIHFIVTTWIHHPTKVFLGWG